MVQSIAEIAAEKDFLRTQLERVRDTMVWKLEGLDEADKRRPLTRSGTNLLGLVKHLIGVESEYLGAPFDRPLDERLPWFEDGKGWHNEDMWATPDESADYIVGFYHRACAISDRTIADLDLDDAGRAADGSPTTLRRNLVLVIFETNRHAGHADIVRELIDGSIGYRREGASLPPDVDDAWWAEYTAGLERAATTSQAKESEQGR